MTENHASVEPAVELEGLRKVYGEFCAVHGLSVSIPRGQIFGFLGPNGAGKTSTIKMMMGILVPTSGTARICGLDCQMEHVEVKRRVGYLPDTPQFYDYLSGSELFRFVAGMHGLSGARLDERMRELFDNLDLAAAEDEFVNNYSMGMKKKMALALALAHEPDLLILDEPTTGLDPHAAQQIRQLIRTWAETGRTVFLSTHLLGMAEKLCDRVAILDDGKCIAEGTPTGLMDQHAADSLESLFLMLTRGTLPEASEVGAVPDEL